MPAIRDDEKEFLNIAEKTPARIASEQMGDIEFLADIQPLVGLDREGKQRPVDPSRQRTIPIGAKTRFAGYSIPQGVSQEQVTESAKTEARAFHPNLIEKLKPKTRDDFWEFDPKSGGYKVKGDKPGTVSVFAGNADKYTVAHEFRHQAGLTNEIENRVQDARWARNKDDWKVAVEQFKSFDDSGMNFKQKQNKVLEFLDNRYGKDGSTQEPKNDEKTYWKRLNRWR
jgi:hypothetical protein